MNTTKPQVCEVCENYRYTQAVPEHEGTTPIYEVMTFYPYTYHLGSSGILVREDKRCVCTSSQRQAYARLRREAKALVINATCIILIVTALAAFGIIGYFNDWWTF